MVTPNPLHANAMMITLQGEHCNLVDAAIEVAEQTGLWLFDAPMTATIQGITMFEITVREAIPDVSVDEGVQAYLCYVPVRPWLKCAAHTHRRAGQSMSGCLESSHGKSP